MTKANRPQFAQHVNVTVTIVEPISYSAERAAELTGVPAWEIYKMIAAGRLGKVNPVPGSFPVIPRSELERVFGTANT